MLGPRRIRADSEDQRINVPEPNESRRHDPGEN